MASKACVAFETRCMSSHYESSPHLGRGRLLEQRLHMMWYGRENEGVGLAEDGDKEHKRNYARPQIQ